MDASMGKCRATAGRPAGRPTDLRFNRFRGHHLMHKLLLLILAIAASSAQADEAVKPKLGPEAAPITADRDYFRTAPAEEYWMLSAFYVPQHTSSDCSAAAAVMAVNALRG